MPALMKCTAAMPASFSFRMQGGISATGFALTAADQLAYNRFLAATAHALGLAIGLKNDVGQTASLVSQSVAA